MVCLVFPPPCSRSLRSTWISGFSILKSVTLCNASNTFCLPVWAQDSCPNECLTIPRESWAVQCYPEKGHKPIRNGNNLKWLQLLKIRWRRQISHDHRIVNENSFIYNPTFLNSTLKFLWYDPILYLGSVIAFWDYLLIRVLYFLLSCWWHKAVLCF